MGIRVKIEGAETIEMNEYNLKTCVFTTDTPDDSNARSTDVANTVRITGKILTATDGDIADDTIKLAKWSCVKAEDADSYRKATIQIVTGSQVVRQVHFPNAFVVDYKESYGDEHGDGSFELVIRQKKDKFFLTEISGGFNS